MLSVVVLRVTLVPVLNGEIVVRLGAGAGQAICTAALDVSRNSVLVIEICWVLKVFLISKLLRRR